MTNALPSPEPVRRRSFLRLLVRTLLLIAGPIVVAVVAAHYYVTGGRIAETDNAYVRADKVAVAPEVTGRVIRVAVDTNDTVTEGQPLFYLDPEPFRIALDRAEARLEMVRTEIAVLRADYAELVERRRLAETDAAFYESEYQRIRGLVERNVMPATALDDARHKLDLALQAVAVRDAEIARTLAQMGGDPNTPDEAFARFRAAKADRDAAERDWRNTVVYAPAEGIIGRTDGLRPGDMIEAGTPVLSLVETDDLWIEANFKETDITHVRVGQTAQVRIDTYPNTVWRAEVASLSPATGAEFALLPPQNATGNWVKVVQRVPIRLRVEEAEGDPPLRLGMSAIVSIDTGYERALPAVVRQAMAWLDRQR